MKRRSFITGLAALSVLGLPLLLAGCSGDSGSGLPDIAGKDASGSGDMALNNDSGPWVDPSTLQPVQPGNADPAAPVDPMTQACQTGWLPCDDPAFCCQAGHYCVPNVPVGICDKDWCCVEPEPAEPFDPIINVCPFGSLPCEDPDFCCKEGSYCIPNVPVGTCDKDWCCAVPNTGTPCGQGFCASGLFCTPNPGGNSPCIDNLCCTPEPEEQCPGDLAADCPLGTTCMLNHSARACTGIRFACYHPEGFIACPGEVLCDSGADFCPAGTSCFGLGDGICPAGSRGAGGYCCRTAADLNQSCDETPCKPGLTCMPNAHCPNMDFYANNVCRGPCGGEYPIDCGNYCCSLTYPECGPPPGDTGDCMCHYGY